MDSKILKFLAFVQDDGVQDVDENNQIWEEYERLYDIYLDHYRERHSDGDDMCEVVEGEYSNHYSHIYARSADGTEYNMDGEFWDNKMRPGDVIGDFLDDSGRIVLVVCKKEDAARGV